MLSLPDFREKVIIICFASDGQKISFQNDNLIIKDHENHVTMQTTCHKIFSLWIVGQTTITTGILLRSKKFAFSVYFMSYTYRPYGILNNATDGNFLLRRKQYEYKELNIGRHLVVNKIVNQTELLKSIRNKSKDLKKAIALMDTYKEHASTANDLQALLGQEGVATRLYFNHWFAEMNWKGRKPRAKIDLINTTLDMGYTYLFNIVECMLNLYGFDVYQGIFHRCFYQRKSLVCDLVEPFRCIIDKQIKRAYGLKQLQDSDFDEVKGQYFLKKDKNRDYIRWLIQSILEYKEDIFSYTQEYYRCFMREKPIDKYPDFHLN